MNLRDTGVPHIAELITGCLHSFDLEERHNASPVMRRFRARCECNWSGPWQRDRDSAREDGMAHWEDQE